jgi:hypothetical protein
MFRKSIVMALFAGVAAASFRMSDDAPVFDPSIPTAEPATQTPATVSVEVPAEHADLLQRAVALLQKGEAWLKDNIEAGISTLENLLSAKDDENGESKE